MIMMSEREREEERRGKGIEREKERERARESEPARESDRKCKHVHLSSRKRSSCAHFALADAGCSVSNGARVGFTRV
jgi:hypothetical protein